MEYGRQTGQVWFVFRNGWTFKNLNEIRTEFNYFPARWEDRNSFGNGAYKLHDRFVGELAFDRHLTASLFQCLVGMRQEELSDWTLRSSVGITYKPGSVFPGLRSELLRTQGLAIA